MEQGDAAVSVRSFLLHEQLWLILSWLETNALLAMELARLYRPVMRESLTVQTDGIPRQWQELGRLSAQQSHECVQCTVGNGRCRGRPFSGSPAIDHER